MPMKQRLQIEVRGIVQGVGFRPHVYRLARRFQLGGSIRNGDRGVVIEVQGRAEDVADFLAALAAEAPTLARIEAIESVAIGLAEDSEFAILESSKSGRAGTLISPDIATCEACVKELLNPEDRRYRYAFLNCTDCGPRFTIVRGVPYDRGLTSMAAFPMCERCRAEYEDPLDRRFHAQPTACRDCGPQLELVGPDGERQSGDPAGETVRRLNEGCIVAVKGLGGFHLAVDAFQPDRVRELRRRKHRGEKPLAVMVASVAMARELCTVSGEEAALLESAQRPIVLLRKRDDRAELAEVYVALAEDRNEVGVVLAYTPLHHLLFAEGGPAALVMTSGNLSEEPIAIANSEAMERLGDIADYFLLHNREILLRCDDSVVRQDAGKMRFIRRSRGYVPSPILLREPVRPILAVGGEMKNTICLSRGHHAFPGQHIGDLESLSAFEFFEESIAHFGAILEVKAEVIAHDLHPGYLATRWAKKQLGVELIGVQHHHAHIAGCMAENHLEGAVIGVALDGTGFGSDGHVWGGEVLVADLQRFERAAHLANVAMPGGDQAIREPWRMAVSFLWQTFGEDWRSSVPPDWLVGVPERSVNVVEQLLRSGAKSPLTSSCGRLFDAVSAMICQRATVSYEAQAAMALEACCEEDAEGGAYPFAIEGEGCLQIRTEPLFAALAQDLCDGVARGVMSGRFHRGLVEVLSETVKRVALRTGLQRVCLSGGSFQNAILQRGLEAKLTDAGFEVFTHTQVPPGDGGLSLGQLAIAAARSGESV